METGNWILIVAMLATALALTIGIVFMATGGKLNKKYSNKLMTLRVVLQAVALAVLAVLFYMKEGGSS